MVKRFGICDTCLKEDGLKENELVKKKVAKWDKVYYEVSDNKVKSKYMSCKNCKKAKSARFAFKEHLPKSPDQLCEFLLHASDEFSRCNPRLSEVSSWLIREASQIEEAGRDYWIHEGVLYFYLEGKELRIKCNEEGISASYLAQLLAK